jgi:hypothetical protein
MALEVHKKSSSNHSLRIIFTAIVISLLGHFVLFFGVPFLSPSLPVASTDEFIIKTDLLPEPPQKIAMAKTVKKKPPTYTDNGVANANLSRAEQGGIADQPGQAFRLPESGTLYYDAYVDGQKYQTGELQWITEGNDYRLYVNIPYAFIGPFVFESRGSLDLFGLAPTIYWTQRGTNAPRYSRFDRDEKGGGKMFFSEKPEFTPTLLPGTQDRFSLMFQFASLLNGNDKIDELGSIRALPVVDYNTLDLWQFRSFGEAISEDVPSLGKTILRRYALIQRENDPYKRQVDIWLAKDLEWLPGRIRSQEANGRVLELVFKQKNPIKPSQISQ